MVSTTKAIVVLAVVALVVANTTTVSRKNVFVSRKRRYLTFPADSNFIITLSVIKPLMQVQPMGWTTLLECDVPFALPQDTRFFKRIKRQIVERKNFFHQLEAALTEGGLDGRACIIRIICDVLQYRKLKGKSLVKDLLYAVFAFPEENLSALQDECTSSLADCPFPLLQYVLGGILLE